MVTMPVAGLLGSTFSGYPIKYFGWTIPNWGLKDESLKDFFSDVHLVTAWVFMTLIGVHAAAAFKHHFIDRDGVLTRMLPRSNRISSESQIAPRQGE
jgi:cytochrome b561